MPPARFAARLPRHLQHALRLHRDEHRVDVALDGARARDSIFCPSSSGLGRVDEVDLAAKPTCSSAFQALKPGPILSTPRRWRSSGD